MSSGVDLACSSVTLLQIKRNILDGALLYHSLGSAENNKSSSFSSGRQSAPQPPAPADPSGLTPALYEQGGDLKLEILKFTGKKKNPKNQNETREALPVNIPSPGLSPTTLGFCPFLVWLCKLFILIPPVVPKSLPLQGQLACHE